MLEATGLSCIRGERVLFRDLAVSAEPGTLLHVTGANGSGKTSLLRILCGLSQPESGDVRWRGRSLREAREAFWQDLLYIGHTNAIKDDLTAKENLEIGCALAGKRVASDEANEALRRFGLTDALRLPARHLSQGQRRRVALAKLALSAALAVWVLDEPFSALDAAATREVEALAAAHLERGGTIVLTTHQAISIPAPRSSLIELAS
jgi:heme exporter protein A